MYYVLLFSFEHQNVKFRHPIFWASQIRNYRSYILKIYFPNIPLRFSLILVILSHHYVII